MTLLKQARDPKTHGRTKLCCSWTFIRYNRIVLERVVMQSVSQITTPADILATGQWAHQLYNCLQAGASHLQGPDHLGSCSTCVHRSHITTTDRCGHFRLQVSSYRPHRPRSTSVHSACQHRPSATLGRVWNCLSSGVQLSVRQSCRLQTPA